MTFGFENIGWTVGNYCNARCGHCYSWKVRRSSDEYLTEKDIDKVVDQLLSIDVKTVNLGGNEPIYTHGTDIRSTLLPYIIRTLSDAGIPVGLTTNGISFSYLDTHHHDELLLINDIDFSLDSPFETEHDLNRGARLYKHVVRCAQRSLEIGIDCSIIACGMRANFNEEYLEQFLSLTQIIGSEFRINTLKPVEPSLIDEMPTPEQFYEGFAYLMQRTDCITLGESCLTAFTGAGCEGCPCGTTSFRINAKTKDGKIPINPCVYMHEFKAGDLLTDDIVDIITGPEFTAFANRRKHLPQACKERGCEFLESCRGGCSARSYLTYGNLESADPYCPQDYLDAGHPRPALPENPHIGCEDGIRVHDNYLCTWIGKATGVTHTPQYRDLDFFLKHDGDDDADHAVRHISGHIQKVDDDEASLVAVSLLTKDEIKRRRVAARP